jgi:hypothetical protein
MCIVQRAHKV